ncbi:MAG: hypothetical protein RLZZ234_239 [Candidatus Parcubacteria bacterium]|jgi:hypothetical protein
MSVTVQNNTINFLSSKEASARSGYTSDYISRLAREGKIGAKRVGITWFIDAASLEVFLVESERAREARKEALRIERTNEREMLRARASAHATVTVENTLTTPRTHTADDVVELLLADEDIAAPGFAPFDGAHRYAFTAVSVGMILAVATVFMPVISRGAQQAFALGSFLEVMQRVGTFAFFWQEDVVVTQADDETPLPLPARQGVVVLPGDASDASIQDVKESFSDEVIVSVGEDNTGTIVPVFGDGTGDTYRFVIVPVGQSP